MMSATFSLYCLVEVKGGSSDEHARGRPHDAFSLAVNSDCQTSPLPTEQTPFTVRSNLLGHFDCHRHKITYNFGFSQLLKIIRVNCLHSISQ